MDLLCLILKACQEKLFLFLFYTSDEMWLEYSLKCVRKMINRFLNDWNMELIICFKI